MEQMELYLLERIIADHDAIYDCYDGHLIRADSEAAARIKASKMAADEGSQCWLDSQRSTCVVVDIVGDEEVIISSFHAGLTRRKPR